MDALVNTWYAAGWADEIDDRSLVGRTILDRHVLLFRQSDGTAKAIGNRCPHRFAPLHLGKHLGDAVQCGYHGLEFDGSGRCSLNPHGGAEGRSVAKVPAYPLVERYGALWIWLGEETPDESLIPTSMAFMTEPGRAEFHGCIVVEANYQLLNDNLMDLSHGMYLHAGSLSTIEMLKNYHPKVEVVDETVTSRRRSLDIPPPALWHPGLPDGTKTVDFFSHLQWDAPSHVVLEVGCLPLGMPHGSPGQIAAISAHLFTPVSDTRTLYFFSFSRDFSIESQDVDAHVRQTTRHAFIEEDKPMIEAQQEMMGTPDLMSLDPLLLKTDAAAVRVRRLLAKKIADERSRGVDAAAGTHREAARP
ncbi:aromatic ring-hydroxylating dioxygenase subunit alpha [Sphingomonas sp. Root720]|uniref:aromatic ring-hydroxylating dioxygenase subunit alpha n=2 Tax=Sphingomonas TaxID=13687 RepID=UPI0006FF4E9E|nr:aromatic ring-hydroxylating dioxygenase subunit alpha [Sphingomonas sp. Root720]KQX19441.1 hypothetical protein ASD17_12980 [Sphingomonas sp. Root1294]KQY65642.1 hypothetical protein ASD39_16180 [Sphingomonas sp. Root50]KRB95054.1 hypothetical protein ASE22_03875 [Sphingomonas sp. Root720]